LRLALRWFCLIGVYAILLPPGDIASYAVRADTSLARLARPSVCKEPRMVRKTRVSYICCVGSPCVWLWRKQRLSKNMSEIFHLRCFRGSWVGCATSTMSSWIPLNLAGIPFSVGRIDMCVRISAFDERPCHRIHCDHVPLYCIELHYHVFAFEHVIAGPKPGAAIGQNYATVWRSWLKSVHYHASVCSFIAQSS
jgi:hypothetical protein